MKNSRLFLTAIATVTLLVWGGQVLAQEHEDPIVQDITTSPLVQATFEDFAPPPVQEVGPNGEAMEVAPIGANAYFEVSDQQKVFSLSPRYKFNDKWTVKARLPWIMEQKRTYWNGEVTASGLGDIALESEYTHQFGRPSRLMRLQASVKMPTGNSEKEVEDDGQMVKVPLGSGSWDILLRGQYTVSTRKSGLLASAMFRKNGSGEAVYQTEALPGTYDTETITTTMGNEFVASVFGRHVVGKGIWLNLGASLMTNGDGEQKSVTEYASGSDDWEFDSALNFKGTLMDLYPGVSYPLGVVTPYLGARIPLKTSYDNELRVQERDTVLIFQLTYRPLKMVD